MQRLARVTAVAMLATMLVPAAALADEGRHRDGPPTESSQPEADQDRIRMTRTMEPPAPVQPADRPTNPSPAPTTDTAPQRDRMRDTDPSPAPTTDTAPQRDRMRDTDHRCTDRVTDARCCPDRPADRLAERCRDHEPPEVDVDIRKLIWRLIHAGEWEKLFRLLRRLHVI